MGNSFSQMFHIACVACSAIYHMDYTPAASLLSLKQWNIAGVQNCPEMTSLNTLFGQGQVGQDG